VGARIRLHVNPLTIGYETFRGVKPALEPGRPVEIEVGCADAQFLFERAAADPSRHYIGLEIREELVAQVNRRARAAGVPVHVVFCQAQLHLEEVLPPASVDRVYVNFPDPWFKRKHHKRRMVDEVLARAIAGVTKPGADVFVQTDVWEVALDALEAFEKCDHAFENRAGAWSFWRDGNPFGARSWREQNAEETGLPIWRIYYARR
jgi:tRNA (guanine-N7-)-methyltransferase